MTDERRTDNAYRWTVRALYATALVLNAWVLWDQVKDTPEGHAITKRVKTIGDRITKPARDAKLFRKHANAVIFEAPTLVEEIEHDDD